MSTFLDLCNEPDDIQRRIGILGAISDHARTKVETILSDKDTISNVASDKTGRITSITYQNSQGKLILTPTGIDRIDNSGTAWSVGKEEQRV